MVFILPLASYRCILSTVGGEALFVDELQGGGLYHEATDDVTAKVAAVQETRYRSVAPGGKDVIFEKSFYDGAEVGKVSHGFLPKI